MGRSGKNLLVLALLAGIFPQVVASEGKQTGSIIGNIKSSGDYPVIIAVERQKRKAFRGKVDTLTGHYRIDQLAPGVYDLLFKNEHSLREGIQMSWDAEAEEAVDGLILANMRRSLAKMEPFFNRKRILRTVKQGKSAWALIEQVRDKPSYRNDGTYVTGMVTRRLDMWRFRQSGSVWVARDKYHLWREEVPEGKTAISLENRYSEELSGIEVKGSSPIRAVTIKAK